MEMTIDINDYVPEEKIRKIAEAELRDSFHYQLRRESDVERVLSNLSYEYIFKIISEEWDGDLEAYLKGKIKEMLSNTQTIRFEVFQTRDFYNGIQTGIDGPGWKILEEECEKCRPIFAETIRKCMDAYEIEKMSKDEISDTIADVIAERLFGNDEEDEHESSISTG